MRSKGDRSQRRRPQQGFPHRVAGYLDDKTWSIVKKAAERLGESMSTFVARAVAERAQSTLDEPVNDK